MKIKYLFLAAVVLACACSSCNRFKALPGLWTGTPAMLGNPGQTSSTAITSMEFNAAEGSKNSGNVVLRAIVNMEGATVPQFDGMVASYALTATASAVIDGKYSIVDDDEILLSLDPASLEVKVDPAAVKYRPGTFSDEQLPIIDSLMPDAAEHLTSVIRPLISQEFYKYNKLDDVKIEHDTMMTFEIGDTDYIFHKANTK